MLFREYWLVVFIKKELLKNNLKADWVNILNANWIHAWQSVNHLHFHIMPRFKDDKLDLWPKIEKKYINRNEIFNIIINK